MTDVVPGVEDDIEAELAAAPPQYRERVELVAKLMSIGQWHGRATARKLSEQWRVGVDQVLAYRRAAAVVLGVPREQLLAQKEETLGRYELQYATATAMATAGTCATCGRPACDPHEFSALMRTAQVALEAQSRLNGTLEGRLPEKAQQIQDLIHNPHVRKIAQAFGRAMKRLPPEVQARAHAYFNEELNKAKQERSDEGMAAA